ncbi:MAG: sugar ABC transporter substrate-binding protein [Thermaceae bacterium]|nr:sugar ABC transporter substrate-binding protein [Thermaceae bacterium]
MQINLSKISVLLALGITGVYSSAGLAQKVSMQFWHYYTDNQDFQKALDNAIAIYQKENPNIEIKQTAIPFGDLKNKIIQGAATRTIADIVIVDNPDHQAMVAQGAFADITDKLKDSNLPSLYFKGPFASTLYKGKNYGLPFVSNATALYYNEEMLKAAGITKPPATWVELQNMAKKLTVGDRYGFCFSAVGTEEGTFTFLPFLWSTGSDLTTFGDAGTVKALEFWNTLVNKDKSVSKAVIGWSQGDVYQQFIAGKCAMMINGPWQLPNFKKDKVAFKWNVAPWPKDKESVSILGGENFALGNGKNVEEAWKFLAWLTKPENLKPLIVTNGSLPNRTDMAKDPTWNNDPVIKLFVEQVSVAKPRAYGAKYPQISEQIWTAFQSVLSGKKSPADAAKEAAVQIKSLLP